MSRRGLLLLAAALAPAAPLAGCGRAGPPRRPGPDEAITFPRRIYPAPDPPPPAPSPAAAPAR